MSKEIIIDGVNVAGCVQLVEEPFYPCGLGGECKGWENCYYKQLKRLEQENAELKAENDRLKARKDKYYQQTLDDEIQINELLQTLQEIKAIADEDCEFCDDIGGCMNNECRKVRILDLITKAEEE